MLECLKRTFQPNIKKRKRVHGFLLRCAFGTFRLLRRCTFGYADSMVACILYATDCCCDVVACQVGNTRRGRQAVCTLHCTAKLSVC